MKRMLHFKIFSLAWLLMSLAAQLHATPIHLGNFVWDDLDRDGQQDTSEPGVPNILVQLWNPAKTSLIASATTNDSGGYTLVAPGAGNYRIRIVLPSSSVTFSPKNMAGGDDLDDSDINPSGVDLGFTDVYTFASNVISTTNIDAGLISDITIGHTIGDRSFVAAADGTQTAGGVSTTVELLSSSGAVLQTTSTISRNGQSGHYSFAAAPGTYRLRFIIPISRVPTPLRDAGGDDGNDSDIDKNGLTPLFTLAADEVRTDLDAGFASIANIGNFIWRDLNANGLQDLGEPGIPGVMVQLWDPLKTTRFDETSTDADGRYNLVGIAPGSYRVYVILPHPTDEFSPIDLGGDDLDDSDVSSSPTNFGFTNTFSLASNVIATTIYDCGIIFVSGIRIIRPTRITGFNFAAANLAFSGTTGGTYSLEHSVDLLSWAPIGSSLVTTSSIGTFTLPASTLDDPKHFWRVRRIR